MPKNARCAVGYCNNDKRYPEYFVQRSHVEKLLFHKWPKNEHLAGIWLTQLKKGRSDLARKERLFVQTIFLLENERLKTLKQTSHHYF